MDSQNIINRQNTAKRYSNLLLMSFLALFLVFGSTSCNTAKKKAEAEAAAKAGNSVEPYFSDTRAKLDAWKVHNAVKMKYAKFAGLQAYDKEDWKTAEKELAAAEGFADQKNPAKVKTKLENARKKLSEKA